MPKIRYVFKLKNGQLVTIEADNLYEARNKLERNYRGQRGSPVVRRFSN